LVDKIKDFVKTLLAKLKENKGVYSFELVFAERKAPITVFLVKESGEWKVFAVSLKESDVPKDSSDTSN
jgi:hypothetical protein